MGVEVAKEVSWHMAHRLYSYDGLCGNLHGHTYKAQLRVRGETNSLGMVEDFSRMKSVMLGVTDDILDHSMLLFAEDPCIDDLAPFCSRLVVMDQNTTAENIAQLLFNLWSKVLAGECPQLEIVDVRVWETATSFALVESLSAKCNIVFNSNRDGEFRRELIGCPKGAWRRPI